MRLTQEQKQAVITNNHLAVIASAGTGKTTVLTQRFLHCMHQCKAGHYNVLAFTFTEKAAREMKDRLVSSQRINLIDSSSLNIGTIHSFCQSVLMRHGHTIGIATPFDVLTEDAATLLEQAAIKSKVQNLIEEKNQIITNMLQYYGYRNLLQMVGDLLHTDENVQSLQCANLESTIDLETLKGFITTCAEIKRDFRIQRATAGTLTFEDLEQLTLELFIEQPHVLAIYQRQFKHILVDEYQDVSPIQFTIIKKLFHPEKNQLFIVGDPKQSIYGFRDASTKIFFATIDLIESHGGERLYLTQTFRTPPRLQTFFNTAFPALFSEDEFQAGVTHKDDTDSYLYLAPTPESKLNAEQTHQKAAKEIADHIKKLIEAKTPTDEIAILSRSRAVLDHYKKELETLGVAIQSEQESKLLDDPAVKLVWQSLKYLSGWKDKLSQIGILRNELLGLSEHFLYQLIKSEDEDLFKYHTLDLFTAQRDQQQWHKINQCIWRWKSLRHSLLPCELFDTIVDDLNIKTGKERLRQLYLIIESWQKRGHTKISDIKRQLTELGDNDLGQKHQVGTTHGVHLLTIHASKGLEFDHVFLIPAGRDDQSRNLFLKTAKGELVFRQHDWFERHSLKPLLSDGETYTKTKEELTTETKEELKRLIYVACTRSKKGLAIYLTKPSQTTLKQFDKSKDASVFKSFNDYLYYIAECVAADQFSHDFPETMGHPKQHDLFETSSLAETPKLFETGLTTKPTFSVTRLETFHQCPKKYELRYIKNIINPTQPRPNFDEMLAQKQTQEKLSAKERGILIHEFLQFYDFKTGDNFDTVIDQALINQHLADHNGHIKDEIKEFTEKLMGLENASRYFVSHLASHEEIAFDFLLDQFHLTGQIDKAV